jgi:hypothetical protein
MPSASERIALVSTSALSAIEAAHPSTRCSIKLAPRPRSASTSGSSTAQKKPSTDVEVEPAQADEVEVRASRLIPDDHVWLSEAVTTDFKLPAVGKDGSNAFPLIRCAAVEVPFDEFRLTPRHSFTSAAISEASKALRKDASPRPTSKPLPNGVASPKSQLSPSAAYTALPSFASAVDLCASVHL